MIQDQPQPFDLTQAAVWPAAHGHACVSVQLLSLGILALQSKRYFEETFYLASAVKRSVDGKHPGE